MRTLRTPALVALWVATAGIYGGDAVRGDEGAPAVFFETRRGNDSGECSGVLVAPQLVLSAGHCAVTPSGQRRRIRRVRVGVARGAVQNIRVDRVVVHPTFDPANPERGGDLALLHLAQPATATPVSLATAAEEEAARHVRIVGFGMTRRRSGSGSPRLHAASLERLSPFHCFSGDVAGMAQTRTCAASPSAGVCPGDSGAPALVQVGGTTKLLGIVSLAIDNSAACVQSAAVLTRVTAFDAWIRSGG